MTRKITTPHGTIVKLGQEHGETVVLLDNPSAPANLNPATAGRLIPGGFQAAPFSAIAMRPSVLRAIADLIEEEQR